MTVYTVSYEGRSLQEFVAALVAGGIRRVADVREAPISRKPGFAKSALSEALRRAGIEYRHLRALGCPKAIRDRYRQDKDWQTYTEAFMAHLHEQQPALAELATWSEAQPTALLCYEADFNRCHRTYVARAVAARTASDVCHLTATGSVPDR